MKLRTSQSGLAGLSLLLGLAVLLIVAGIGVLIYNKNPSQDKAPQSSQTPTANPDGTSTTPNGIPDGANTPPAATPASEQNVITVSKVSMRINVPDSLKDLTYHTRTTAENSTIISFSSSSLTSSIPGCAADKGNGAFATVTRGAGNYPGPANPSSGGLLKQYGGYYFAYSLPSSPCATGLSVDQQNLLNNLAQDFYGSLDSVKAS